MLNKYFSLAKDIAVRAILAVGFLEFMPLCVKVFLFRRFLYVPDKNYGTKVWLGAIPPGEISEHMRSMKECVAKVMMPKGVRCIVIARPCARSISDPLGERGYVEWKNITEDFSTEDLTASGAIFEIFYT